MDTAFQKLIDIQYLLSSCAELLAVGSAGAPPSVVAAASQTSASAPEHLPADDSALSCGREKLSHYIVRLESELEYYKQLCNNSAQESRSNRQQTDRVVAPAGKTEAQCTPTETAEIEDGESRALFLVFRQLSTADLCRASLVCRQWRLVAAHPLLWTRVHIENVLLPPRALQAMATRCRKCNVLSLQGLMPVMAHCDEELQTYIRRIKGCLEPSLALFMSTSGSSLQHVHLVDCDLLITERCLWLLSVHCPNLVDLTYSSEAFPPTKEALWSLSNGCPLIRQLNLPPVNAGSEIRQLDDSCLEQIRNGWPNLLQLSFGSHSITYQVLASLVHHCWQLQSLELTECPPIDNNVVSHLCKDGSLSALHTLTLMFTRITPQAVVSIIENCHALVNFDLYITSSMYAGTNDPQAAYKYLTLLDNLKNLDDHPALRNVFHLHHIE